MARGDPRFIGYAQAVITPFVSAMTADLLLVRGQLLQYRHEFELALEDFAAALRLNPDLAQAHAWRGAIYLVQGNYDTTREACQALTTLGREALAGACKGLLQAYGGQLQAADQTLQQALKLSSQPESQLWLLTRLAEVAAWRGQAKQAEQHYKVALALQLDDGYLLAAWSDFLLDAGRPAEVVKQLAGWEASDSLLLRLAEAEAALKSPAAARLAQALDERFAAARVRGDTTHRAEEARYQLRLRGDAAQALRLAVENYRVQREPRDARILLEAAIAAGDPAAAQVVRDWLASSGFEDARLRRLGKELCEAVSPCGTALVTRR
jgi:tetratricopeptide (TPR) repeat protein